MDSAILAPMDLPESLAPLRRTAWIPRVEVGADPGKGSKFGGTAWLPRGSEHPACGVCSRPLPLIAQLDVATLPEPDRFGGSGLLQLFYCVSVEPVCEVEAEAFFPYARSVVARRVDPLEPGAPSAAAAHRPFEPKAIVGWDVRDDYPNPEEQGEHGVDLAEDEIERLEDEFPIAGEKLWGWPLWVQGIEYPTCKTCGGPMQLVLQIDSEGLIDHMWGDSGCAHLTQCPAHPDQLAFGWACG